ncbi:MFS transporter [Bombilactobacillus thymidiniphilus]|uniref:MFS transporter n=1 Tax=Bombilactobacillus thymidiniphilus TaxID=2923363 RepID=A0ABY4PDY9_9LACO|nr:MFS transporter [Bombilactobacillus thymidiniphilus]UQS83960.1 MFS transporter [Bombilactobacillus thymidiniphilus]
MSKIIKELFNTLKIRKISVLVITISLFQSTISVLVNFLQLFLSEKHFSPFQISIVLTVALAFSAFTSLSIGKVSGVFGAQKAIKTSLVLVLGAFLILKTNIYIILFSAVILLQCGFEFVDTSLNVVIQDLSNDKIRTSLISSVNTLTACLMFFETALITALFSLFKVEYIFIFTGILATSLTLILYFIFL